jgi:hypothetical protein
MIILLNYLMISAKSNKPFQNQHDSNYTNNNAIALIKYG